MGGGVNITNSFNSTVTNVWNININVTLSIDGFRGASATMWPSSRPYRTFSQQWGVANDGRGGIYALVGPNVRDLVALSILDRMGAFNTDPFQGIGFAVSAGLDRLMTRYW